MFVMTRGLPSEAHALQLMSRCVRTPLFRCLQAFGLGFFDDDQTLGEESEALLQDSNHNTNGAGIDD